MKSFLCRLALPAMVFLIVATGCSKTTDPTHNTAVVVTCVRTNMNPDAPQLGTEIILTRQESGDRYANFAMVPSSLTFDDLMPGTYELQGMNSNSTEKLTLQVHANERTKAELTFAE
jgi:hypothetical protein